jgi:hypothetical protein
MRKTIFTKNSDLEMSMWHDMLMLVFVEEILE